jgi:DNA-binding CsgD family transcriptional regulator
MSLDAAALSQAADGLLETGLLGAAWDKPVERLTAAAGAFGAALVRAAPARFGNLGLGDECVLATDSIAVDVAEYLAGRAPPDPRTNRVAPTFGQGFVTDYDEFSPHEIERNAFYEEFLRPRGVRWHACARIDDGAPELGALYLSLKRSIRFGHYDAAEVGAINAVLPTMRAATAVARAVMRAETRGAADAFGRGADAVIELERRGLVLDVGAAALALMGRGVDVVRGRLSASLPRDRVRLERAIAAALDAPPRVGCAVVGTTTTGPRLLVRTVPVLGAARDVFSSVAALVIVRVVHRPDRLRESAAAQLRDAFDLTAAEARVAALVGLGIAPSQAARLLGIGIGTVRNHLKTIMAKAGVRRQPELVALIGELAD